MRDGLTITGGAVTEGRVNHHGDEDDQVDV